MELFEKGQLPPGTTWAQAEAADRANRGDRLGPAARRSLRQLQKKLDQETRDRNREDWSARDQILRNGAVSPAAPRPSTVVPSESPVGGGGVALRRSSFDANRVSSA